MLVDTHIFVWLIDDDPRLGDRARELMVSRYPLYYSSMSVLEMVIKKLNGRLAVPDDICAHLDRQGFQQLPLGGGHAEALVQFPELLGHDPFDRALLAQAKVERLDFLTADRRLLTLGHDWIIDAAV